MSENNDSYVIQKKLDMKLWGRLLPYINKVKKPLATLIVTTMLMAVGDVSMPLFTRYAVNNFVTPQSTEGMGLFIAVFLAVTVSMTLLSIIYARAAIVVDIDMSKIMRRDTFIHLQKLPLSYFNKTSIGYIIARVMSDTGRLSGMVGWGVAGLAWNVFYVIGVFIAMFILNAKLALLLLILVPIILLITSFFKNKMIDANSKMRHANSKITGAYNEGITGAKTSKTLVIEDKNCEEFGELTQEMYKASMRTAMLNGTFLPIIIFFSSMAVAIVLYYGGHLTMNNLLDYGVLSAFISYAVGILEPIQQIAGMFAELISAQVNLSRVTSLLDEECTVSDSPEVVEKYGDVFSPKPENWEPIQGDIEFKNIWFKYPDGDDYVLEDFNLKIPAGTNVAIVGETGAGKSTLVNLACRFFEPTRGEILIDGVDYRERSQLWLHSSLGYVLQNPHLFSGTIRENIRYGKLDATDEDIYAAAKLVSADAVAEKMEKGYDSDVGEGGDRLSTGEKQLVSFARAVIADPKIFVLDEATSSIDTETEMLIQNAIAHILQGRTSFLIAHRLSTIRHADLILVVSGGKIIEQGNHEELISKKGNYHALYTAMMIKETSER